MVLSLFSGDMLDTPPRPAIMARSLGWNLDDKHKARKAVLFDGFQRVAIREFHPTDTSRTTLRAFSWQKRNRSGVETRSGVASIGRKDEAQTASATN